MSIILQTKKNIIVFITKIRGSSFWINLLSTTGATVISNLIGVITLGYSARIIGPYNNGLISYGTSLAAYASLLLLPGLVSWGTRSIAQDHSKAGENLVLINFTQLILGFVGFLGLLLYSLYYLKSDEQRITLLCGLSIFNAAINLDWAFYGLELMKVVAAFRILTAALNTICLFVFITKPEHFYRLPLLSFFIPLFIQLLEFLILVWRYKIKLVFAFKNLKNLFIAALPLSIASIVTTIYSYINNLLIKNYLGSTLLGIYSAANRLIEVAVMLIPLMSTIINARISHLVISDKNNAIRSIKFFIDAILFYAFGVSSFFFIESNSIVSIIYGQQYISATNTLKVLCGVLIFGGASSAYMGVLYVFGKDRYTLLTNFFVLLISVGGGLLLIPKYSIIGAGWTRVFMNMTGLLISLPIVFKLTGSIQLKSWILPIIGSITVILLGYFLRILNIPFPFRVIIEAVGYFSINLSTISMFFKEFKFTI